MRRGIHKSSRYPYSNNLQQQNLPIYKDTMHATDRHESTEGSFFNAGIDILGGAIKNLAKNLSNSNEEDKYEVEISGIHRQSYTVTESSLNQNSSNGYSVKKAVSEVFEAIVPVVKKKAQGLFDMKSNNVKITKHEDDDDSFFEIFSKKGGKSAFMDLFTKNVKALANVADKSDILQSYIIEKGRNLENLIRKNPMNQDDKTNFAIYFSFDLLKRFFKSLQRINEGERMSLDKIKLQIPKTKDRALVDKHLSKIDSIVEKGVSFLETTRLYSKGGTNNRLVFTVDFATMDDKELNWCLSYIQKNQGVHHGARNHSVHKTKENDVKVDFKGLVSSLANISGVNLDNGLKKVIDEKLGDYIDRNDKSQKTFLSVFFLNVD